MNAIVAFAQYEVQDPLVMQRVEWTENTWEVLYTDSPIGHIHFTKKTGDSWMIDQVYFTGEVYVAGVVKTRAMLDTVGNALVKRLSLQGLIDESVMQAVARPAETSMGNEPQGDQHDTTDAYKIIRTVLSGSNTPSDLEIARKLS